MLELRNKRKKVVQRLVAPLLPQPPNLQVEQVGPGRDEFTLATLPKGSRGTPFFNPEDAIVPTRVAGLFLNYFETWIQHPDSDEYYLHRAYMHMHIHVSKGNSRQVLSLHCDPALDQSEGHFKYKRGPHFHVSGANPNIDRAHISLCLLDHELGGRDIKALTNSLDSVIRMMSKELLPCWERAARAMPA
jgi:hypothetical protein